MSSWYPSRIDPHVGNFVQRFAELLVNDYNVSVIHTLADKNCSTIEVSDQLIAGVRTVIVYFPENKWKIGRWLQRRKALARGFRYVEDVDLILLKCNEFPTVFLFLRVFIYYIYRYFVIIYIKIL
jgi:hypothetical protein